MNDVLEAVSARIKAPYFGYVFLAFIAINWRAIFVLTVSDGTPQERLAAFDIETSFFSLLVAPLLAGAVLLLTSPWLRYGVALISKTPHHLFDLIQLDSDHRKTLRKTELEQSRTEFFANKETELIDRAKRDKEIEGIEDEGLKARLALQIESLRRERDELSETLTRKSRGFDFSKAETDLLKAASLDESGSIIKNVWLGGRSIAAGNQTFGEHDKREYLMYETALKSLVSRDLVQIVGAKDGIHELTYTGWQVADSLP